MNYLSYFLTIVSISLLFSCVPSRQFEDLKAKNAACEEQLNTLKAQNNDLSARTSELMSQVSELEKKIRNLESDTSMQGNSLRRLQNLYNELTQSYDKLLSNNEKLLAGNVDETKKVISQLQKTQDDLQRREDELKKLEKEVNEKSKKVEELESILSRKDSTVAALKKAVTNALLGFKSSGLTVDERNGKVYVSMEERLLFASGSTVVDKKGAEALKELSKVLEKHPDINIMVEGHTDDVPISTAQIKDNWDLSVLRATSVTRILLQNGSINPSRITAAGRGEFTPIAQGKTAEDRKKNRRTEVILTPKLDELLKVLETN